MFDQPKRDAIRAARVYLRVSTDEQDLTRQEAIVGSARASGFLSPRFTGRKRQALDPTAQNCCAW